MFYHNFSFTNKSVNSLYDLRPPILYSRISISFSRLLFNLLVILRSFYFTVSAWTLQAQAYSRMTIPDCFRILYIFPILHFRLLFCLKNLIQWIITSFSVFPAYPIHTANSKITNVFFLYIEILWGLQNKKTVLSKRGKNVLQSNCLISAAIKLKLW